MNARRDEIRSLINRGFSHREIARKLRIARSLVAYYSSDKQKEKSYSRRRNRNLKYPFESKYRTFVSPRRRNQKKGTYNTGLWKEESRFTCDDLMKKFGISPMCYLCGKAIDIYDKSSYAFDHIIPRSRGGNSCIENLGICCTKCNTSKSSFTIKEYLEHIFKVLHNFGYDTSQIINKEPKETEEQ